MGQDLMINNGFIMLTLDENYDISAGGFWDGLCHVIEGAACAISGFAAWTAASSMTGTTIATAACLIGTAAFGTIAVAAGVVAIGYGVYEMLN